MGDLHHFWLPISKDKTRAQTTIARNNLPLFFFLTCKLVQEFLPSFLSSERIDPESGQLHRQGGGGWLANASWINGDFTSVIWGSKPFTRVGSLLSVPASFTLPIDIPGRPPLVILYANPGRLIPRGWMAKRATHQDTVENQTGVLTPHSWGGGGYS